MYTYTYIYVNIYMYMYTFTCVFMYIYIYVCMHIIYLLIYMLTHREFGCSVCCVSIFMYLCVSVYFDIHTLSDFVLNTVLYIYVYSSIYMYICIYVYICMYMYVYFIFISSTCVYACIYRYIYI